MVSRERENEDESIWLSPEASQALFNEYQEFLDKYQQQLKQQLAQKTSEVNIEKLMERFVEENDSWRGKLTLCDPETFETFIEKQEARQKEKEWQSLSPEGKDLKIWGEKVIKEIERQNEEEGWKSWKRQLMKNSWRQIKLLEKIENQQDAILQFERDAVNWRGKIIPNVGVMFFVIFIIGIIIKVFF